MSLAPNLLFKISNAFAESYGPKDTAYQPSSNENIFTFSVKIVENLLVASLALTMLGSVSTCIQRISFAVTAEPIKRYIVRIILIIIFPTPSDLVLSSDLPIKYLQ